MSDEENELLKTGMEIVLRPVTDVAENAIGLLGGDWLSEKRRANRLQLKRRTDELLRQRKVDQPVEPPPSVVLPLLSNAQEESREELIDLWARLLAAAADPGRNKKYRREFAEIVKQLEPLDAAVLPSLAASHEMLPYRSQYIAAKLSVPEDQVLVSFRNLRRLELAHDQPGATQKINPCLTALGREFLSLVS